MARVESLLAARLFLSPQVVGDRVFFISNLSGRLSLYVMDYGGSVPEPLLPPNVALQNPDLLGGTPFFVFPQLGKILVVLDRDGDENYQPMTIPIDGGFPEPAFGAALAEFRAITAHCDPDTGVFYVYAESRHTNRVVTYRADLAASRLDQLAESGWGFVPEDHSDDHSRVLLSESYTFGDRVVYEWEDGELRLLYGTPLADRAPGQQVAPNGIHDCQYTSGGGVLCVTALLEDTYGLGYLRLERPQVIEPVAVTGVVHQGVGELEHLERLHGDRFMVTYNIDGTSWFYEGRFDDASLTMRLEHVVCGQGELGGGVAEAARYDEAGDRIAVSFSTAVSPTQIYTVEGADRSELRRHTRERVLGLPATQLAPGEDASFISHDGLRVSARLYLPAAELGFQGPRPLVYYIHGGPQSQERPNFAWFSMPLIQLLTLRGFAVFVPNARGSTGYGQSYMKRVDRDWGGLDRLDHVHAMTQVLPRDSRLDVTRSGVVGRSYGGYMTLTLAMRHPELWRAAVDMFGPYDLLTFMDRIPPTWKPYFAMAVGDPERDREFLVERSPRSYIDYLACPLLVIQGANDPRVVERESRDVVEELVAAGKQASLLVFDDEGHDVLKYENRVTCYEAIAGFFAEHLEP